MIVSPKASASITLTSALALALLALSNGGTGAARQEAPLVAQQQLPDAAAGAGIVAGLGVVEPASGMIDLAALMPGVLASVAVDEGDAVKRGQILAELVNDDLKAKVGQAEATVAMKAAQLDLIEAGPRPQEIEKAAAQLREEESAIDLLQRQYDRRRTLARQGAVSTEAFNEAASSLAASRERRSAAEQALSILRQGSRRQEIESARAELKLAESQLAEARAVLGKSYVRASTDGVVLRRYKEPGEAMSTQPAVPVIQIADLSEMVVRTQIDENDIAGLRVGQTATISAAALGGKTVSGRVARISPRLGAKTVSAESPTEKRDTRVLDVIVALDEGTRLPVNLRVDVKIDLGSGGSEPEALRGAIFDLPPMPAGYATRLAAEGDVDPASPSTATGGAPSPEPAVATDPLRDRLLALNEIRS